MTADTIESLRKRLQKAEGLLSKYTHQLGGCKDALRRMTQSRDTLRGTLANIAHELEHGEAAKGDTFEIKWLADDAHKALKESRRHAK